MNVNSLITDLAFIMLLGAVVTLLFKWLKQPVVLGYIVAGFLASPHFTYLPSVTDEANIEFWAQLGIVFLLFSLGLEFSFKKLLNAGGSAVVTALTIVVGMLVTGFGIGKLLGFSFINSLFLGGMLSMSSTTIIIKAFTDLNLRRKKFASLVFAVLIVEDLFAVLMMVLLSSIAINKTVEGSEMIYSVSKLFFFLIIWFLVGVFVLPTLLNGVRRWLNAETTLVVSMGLCLGMAVFSVGCGFSLALGAFVMGSILAGTSFAERIEHVTEPVKDLFGAVFFISVGMMVNPEIIVQYWVPILILSAVVIVGMIVFGTTGMLLTGQTLRVAIESGFSLTQIGEFAFIIATLGMSLHVLNPEIYPIVVAVSVITTFTTPYFIRMADPVYGFIERHLPARLNFLINRYTERAATESETGRLWRSVLKRYVWRIVVYAVLLTAITLLSTHYLIPWLAGVLPRWGRLAGAVATLFVMSPFLVAMCTPASRKVEIERLRDMSAHIDVPLKVMRLLRVLISLGFVVYLLSSIYSRWIGWTFGLAVMALLLFTFSKKVRRRMRSIESRFLDNLNERDLRRTGRNNNLVSNMHLAFLTVGYDCPFVGERLADSDLRRRYGVNVASIQRGSNTLLVPSGNARVFPGDVLGVIGTDDQIQQLIPEVELQHDETTGRGPTEVRLTSILLSQESPLVGRTSQTARLRDHWQALLVNIQRGETFMEPDGTTEFQAGDVLWLVGDSKRLEALR